jgi:hypothetical protein
VKDRSNPSQWTPLGAKADGAKGDGSFHDRMAS